MELEYQKIAKAVREVFGEYLGSANPEMANKWIGGELVLRPGTAGAQEKVLPIDDFYHKIVMLRDQLRVLEQKINTAPELPDVKRAEWQQHLSRIYGTLTTFNVLFADAGDRFVGQKSPAEGKS